MSERPNEAGLWTREGKFYRVWQDRFGAWNCVYVRSDGWEDLSMLVSDLPTGNWRKLTADGEEPNWLRLIREDWQTLSGFATCDSAPDDYRVTIKYPTLEKSQAAYGALHSIGRILTLMETTPAPALDVSSLAAELCNLHFLTREDQWDIAKAEVVIRKHLQPAQSRGGTSVGEEGDDFPAFMQLMRDVHAACDLAGIPTMCEKIEGAARAAAMMPQERLELLKAKLPELEAVKAERDKLQKELCEVVSRYDEPGGLPVTRGYRNLGEMIDRLRADREEWKRKAEEATFTAPPMPEMVLIRRPDGKVAWTTKENGVYVQVIHGQQAIQFDDEDGIEILDPTTGEPATKGA